MMTQKKQKSYSEKNKDQLAKALRENLMKRKQRQRVMKKENAEESKGENS